MRASKPVDSASLSVDGEEAPGPDIRLCVDEVKTIMRLAGWTNAELARQMGMDQSAVMRLLDGRLQLGRRSLAGLLTAVRRRFGGHVCFCGLVEVIDAEGDVISLRDPDQAKPGVQ